MSLVSAAPLFTARNSRSGYQIEQSLRFRGNSTYFTKTFGSSGNRRKFTLSVWVKKATVIAVSPNNTGLNFFGSNSGSVGDSMNVGMNADTTAIQFYQYNNGYTGGIFSAARYRDPSAWMHMVFVWDSAQATQSNRMAVYVNNRIERPDGSDGSPDTGPSQNKDAAWNYSSYTHTIGGTYQTNDMYIAEAYHIDGQALDPSSFGEYDSNGVWRPIKPAFTESSRYSASGYEAIFDGNTSNGVIVYNSYVTVASGLNITATSTIGFHDNGGSQLKSMRINGTTELTVTGGSGWQDFSFTGTINTIELKYNGSTLYTGIRVDGTTLVDNYGDYGQNGFYLKFDPSATNGIGHDHSGNGNNWSPTGFTTSGGGTDVMSDTPTTNWCTLNTLVRPGNTAITNGNLTYSTSIAEHALSTFGVTEGKWYCEVTLGGANFFAGLVNSADYRLSYIGSNTLFAVADNNSEYSPNSTRSFSSLSSFTTGDVIGFVLDATNKTCDVYKNNSKVLTYDTFTLDGPYFFSFDRNAPTPSVTHTVNFGQREFAYPPGTYSATDYFNTVTYTGTSSAQSITGVGFQPDLVWVKRRDSSVNSHALFDVARGAGERISSNEASQEVDNTSYFTSFNSDGFSVALNGGETNLSGATYVAWCWKAGGTASSNTDGSQTASVSANDAAGFSVMTWNYGGSSSYTVGHGLSTAPKVLFLKKTDGSTNWFVRHGAIHTGNGALFLNTNTTGDSGSTVFNGTDPTDSVISLNGAITDVRGAHVCYAFAEKAGVSKFGSYTGNGSVDGPEINDLGFAPALLVIKRTDAASEWAVYDSARGNDNQLRWDQTDQDNTNSAVNVRLTSSGFKIATADAAQNANGGTYIYMAWARNFSADADYKELNTKNLPAPTIKDGSDYFNTVLWTGTSAEHAITGVGFQPDWSWIKGRTNTTNHVLVDAVRGATAVIESDSDVQEYTDAESVKSFDTDGVTLGTSNDVNNSTASYNSYVGWFWKANGSGSTNTDGNLSNTVTVSANPSAGFSIVSYTGDGVSNATVGHGLNAVPSLVMSKVLTGSTGPWYVKHKDLSSGYNIYLNWTNAQTALTSGGGIGDLNSSTTFTCANGSTNNGNVNTSGRNYITYCFSEVPGFSKFGKYIGNGNADGPFVATSFAPAWLMIKNASAATGWYMVDNTRNTYNEADEVLFADLSNAESVNDANGTDILSNGFKIRDTGATFNTSGSTYIYAAFAENPFGGSGVSPATAR